MLRSFCTYKYNWFAVCLKCLRLLWFVAHKIERAALCSREGSQTLIGSSFHLWHQEHTATAEYFNNNPLVRNSKGTLWGFFTAFSFWVLPSNEMKSYRNTTLSRTSSAFEIWSFRILSRNWCTSSFVSDQRSKKQFILLLVIIPKL